MSSLEPLIEGPLMLWSVTVRAADVVFVKGIFEASEGVGSVLAERRPMHRARSEGGCLTIAAPTSRAREVEALLDDLRAELGPTMRVTRDRQRIDLIEQSDSSNA